MSTEKDGFKWRADAVPTATAVEEPDFFSRWSRRKQALGKGEQLEEEPAAESVDTDAVAAPEEPEVKVDPRTGKPYDELTDEDMPEVETLDQDSDVSMFMAKNISPALRMKALARVFHSAKFNKVCLCAEYADDYTNFTPMGDIVPHDLKSAIAREATKLRDRLREKGLEMSEEDAQARIAAESRGEKLPDIEELAEKTTSQELEQAEAERPDRLQG